MKIGAEQGLGKSIFRAHRDVEVLERRFVLRSGEKEIPARLHELHQLSPLRGFGHLPWPLQSGRQAHVEAATGNSLYCTHGVRAPVFLRHDPTRLESSDTMHLARV